MRRIPVVALCLIAAGAGLWLLSPPGTGPVDPVRLGRLVFWVGVGYLGCTMIAQSLLDRWLGPLERSPSLPRRRRRRGSGER